MRLEVNVKGVDKVEKRFAKMVKQATQPRSAFSRIADELIDSNKRAWGRRWEPLKPSTIKSKRSKGQSAEPLVATGKLKKSLTVRGAEGQILRYKKDELVFGTDLFYANFHNKPRKNEPKRQLIRVLPKERKNIREIILKHLIES